MQILLNQLRDTIHKLDQLETDIDEAALPLGHNTETTFFELIEIIREALLTIDAALVVISKERKNP